MLIAEAQACSRPNELCNILGDADLAGTIHAGSGWASGGWKRLEIAGRGEYKASVR